MFRGQSSHRPLRLEVLEERRLLALVTVTTANDLVDFNDGVTSLREAVFATNIVPGADTIHFDFGHDGPATIHLAQGELKITDSLAINGSANLLTIDTGGTLGSRIFNIDDGNNSNLIDVSISGLTLTGARANTNGGAIYSVESLSVSRTTIRDNFAAQGGAIFNREGVLSVADSTISGNSAVAAGPVSGSGGGIYILQGTLVIAHSTITGNSAFGRGSPGTGGGVYVGSSNATIIESKISNNSCTSGGGIFSRNSELTIFGGSIDNNSSTGKLSGTFGGGGGIFGDHGRVTITGCRLADNTAEEGGGSVFAQDAILTLANSTISGSHAKYGGGMYLVRGEAIVQRSTLDDNRADDQQGGGGGILNVGRLSVIDSTINHNIARAGAGILSDDFHGGGGLTISNSTISGNSASSTGGGLSLYRGPVVVGGSTISGNSTGVHNGGGGIYQAANGNISTSLTVSHTIVAGNIFGGSTPRDIYGAATLAFSLIGVSTGATITDNGGNLIGTAGAPIDPLLGSMADNGASTKTHALLAGSPAIDAGDPNFDPANPDGDPMTDDAVTFDQRGAPYARVFDGNSNGSARIDIGAYESQPVGVQGDYNQNGIVDTPDYTVWRDMLGATIVPPFFGADGDGDGVVDEDDFGVWKSHFGQTVPPPGSGAGEASSVEIQELRADAPAVRNFAADYLGRSVVQIPMETISAPAETDAAAARSAGIAVLETRYPGHDSSTRSRRTIHRYQVAESGGDDLPLLLAIDRVGRSMRQDSFVNDDSGNGERRADDDGSESEIDEPLAATVAVRQGARSTCILPG